MGHCLYIFSLYIFLLMLHFSAGCDLLQGRENEVTGYSGESVVLPCSCTDPLAKPDQLKWKLMHMNSVYEIYPIEQTERYKNRIKLLNQTAPGNLSLHISSLTKEDAGDYTCEVSYEQYIYVRLHVKEKPHVHTIYTSTYQSSQQTHELITTQQLKDKLTEDTNVPHHTPRYVFILMAVFASVLLLILLIFIYWRCKGNTNIKTETSDGPELMREPEKEDEVAYSAVFHVKTASTQAAIQNDTVENTEYASINVK